METTIQLIKKYNKISNNTYLSDLLSNYNLNNDSVELYEFLKKLLNLKIQCIKNINMFSGTEFFNKTVLITGGSSGIGKTLVDLYLLTGAKVIVFDIKDPNNSNVEYHKVDVSDKKQIEEAVSYIKDLDILITSAGLFDFDNNMNDEQKQRMVDVNVLGVENMCEVCMPLLQKSNGQICTITSGLSKTIDPTCLLYCITKQEIIKLTKKYASLYEITGVRVNSVLPGPILTPLLVNVLPTIEDLIEYGNLNPENMIGIPEWVGLEVLRVTSNNQYNNYQSIEVDCGETLMSEIENNKYWTPDYKGDFTITIGEKVYSWDNPYVNNKNIII